MKKEELQQLLNKETHLILSNNYNYTGVIKELTETSLLLLDQYGLKIRINLDNITIVMPVMKGGSKDGPKNI